MFFTTSFSLIFSPCWQIHHFSSISTLSSLHISKNLSLASKLLNMSCPSFIFSVLGWISLNYYYIFFIITLIQLFNSYSNSLPKFIRMNKMSQTFVNCQKSKENQPSVVTWVNCLKAHRLKSQSVQLRIFAIIIWDTWTPCVSMRSVVQLSLGFLFGCTHKGCSLLNNSQTSELQLLFQFSDFELWVKSWLVSELKSLCLSFSRVTTFPHSFFKVWFNNQKCFLDFSSACGKTCS